MLKRPRVSSGLRCIICAACNLKSASSVVMKQLKLSQLQSRRAELSIRRSMLILAPKHKDWFK